MSETTPWAGPAPPRTVGRQQPVSGRADGANLADILERVLDKGIVIAGDIQVNLLDIELLTIKIRLVVASVERAKEMGIDWWERDPTLSAGRRELEDENRELRERVEALELDRDGRDRAALDRGGPDRAAPGRADRAERDRVEADERDRAEPDEGDRADRAERDRADRAERAERNGHRRPRGPRGR